MTALRIVVTHGFAIGGDTATGMVMTVETPLTVIVNWFAPGPGVTVMVGVAPAGP